jgi:transcriptional regulator with XRE-family HTH domain|nr:MAG TPA: structural protein [Bacteriophage sp.]
MDSNTGQTFIEEMQPNFDALPERLKDEKFRNHLTNQQLSDVSGVPIATTSRILSGAVSNPGFFHIAALCAAMDVSMDSVAGVHPSGDQAEIDQLRQEIAYKDEIIAEKGAAIDRLLDRSRIMEAGVAARDDRISKQSEALSKKDSALASVQRENKPLIYGQCALNILLTAVLMVYMVLDARNPEMGLIRSEKISAVILLGAAGIAAVFMLTAFLIFHKLLSGGERNGKKKKGA